MPMEGTCRLFRTASAVMQTDIELAAETLPDIFENVHK